MTTKTPSYTFGDYEFRNAELQLLRNGAPVPFTRQSAEVLSHLIENRDRTVSRSELISKFWASSPIGADDRLNTCIRRIRTALDQGKSEQSFIETRPRLGYRFLTNVDLHPKQTKEKSRFWDRVSSVRLAGALAFGAVLAVPLFYFNTSPAPESVYIGVHDGHAYELQKFGDLRSSCQFEQGANTGECSFAGSGYIRVLLQGEEVMRTDVPQGAVLKSMLQEGRIRFRLSKPSSIHSG